MAVKGLFFVLEGIDGAGHSTHARRLGEWLEAEFPELRGKVVLTREPTDGPIGSLIRSALKGEFEVGPRALALLFTADRLEHVRTIIEPKLREGCVIVSDRYYLSTLAYQSASGVDLEWLMALNAGCPRPDLTILLDAPAEVCWARLRSCRSHLELFEDPSFLEAVRQRFLKLAEVLKEKGERIVIVNTDRPFEEAHREVVEHVKAILFRTRGLDQRVK